MHQCPSADPGPDMLQSTETRKFSLKVGFKFFMKEISVHYKLQTKHNLYIY